MKTHITYSGRTLALCNRSETKFQVPIHDMPYREGKHNWCKACKKVWNKLWAYKGDKIK